ncbi:MAG: helicase [Ilumatobacteraceae bacterium]
MRQRSPDDGQAVVLVIGVVAVAAGLLLSIARLGTHLDAAARAQGAADAAALAGFTGGRNAAAALADANGAVLVGFAEGEQSVVVTVRVGDAEATARATSNP